MKSFYSSSLGRLFIACFFLIGFSNMIQAQNPSVDVQVVPAADATLNGQYCVDIQVLGENGANYIGNSSIYMSYDPNVVLFEGSSTFGVTTGTYTSINFDGDQSSIDDDCQPASGGLGITPYSEHGFDGLTAGNILITVVLLNQTIGTLVFACPQIENDWETVSTVCFQVLDPDGDPNFDFIGDENGMVVNTTGTNFNPDNNDPADKYYNGDLIPLNAAFSTLTSTTDSGCTDPTACNYDMTVTSDDGSCTYATVWYLDNDGDGLGDPNASISACEQPAGYVGNSNDDNDGCNGTLDCAGVCNGTAVADECGVCNGPGASIWYEDADGDGLGNAAVSQSSCTQPAGYVSNADDTNDGCNGTLDCAGVCNGSAVVDECGVCNGSGASIWYEDADGDGLGNPAVSQSSCTQPAGYVSNADDTNDGCNGTLDCAGVCNGTSVVDECGVCGGAGAGIWYEDADGDGLGNAAVSQSSCTQPVGYVANANDDCDGTLDCAGVCNGSAVVDECGVCNGPGAAVWYQDADGDGLGNAAAPLTSCTQPDGYVSNSDDDNDGCSGTFDECGVCDGPGPLTWYEDADGDGLGNVAVTQSSCTQPTGYVANASDDCDGTLDCAGVCNGAAMMDECGVCDGPGAAVWYQDADGDGLGNAAVSQSSCTQPAGYVSNSDDDNDGCDGTFDCAGVCNGTAVVDECGVCGGSGPATWYEDADGDGLGNPAVSQTSCTQPAGYVSNADDTDDGCDGTFDCAGVCNGTSMMDECGVCGGSGPATWYQDNDGDGLGNPAVSQSSCTQPAGYVSNGDDDNDGCDGTFDCAGVCNGTAVVDECGVCGGSGAGVWYEDADGDGLGNPAVSQSSCTQPAGYVGNSNDENDGCSGAVDECGVCNGPGPSIWYEDADGDGLGNPTVTQTACAQPAGYVSNFGDNCDGALDCAGVCNGPAMMDECGVCNGSGPATWYQDNDGDGLGNPAVSQTSCTQPAGYVGNGDDPSDGPNPNECGLQAISSILCSGDATLYYVILTIDGGPAGSAYTVTNDNTGEQIVVSGQTGTFGPFSTGAGYAYTVSVPGVANCSTTMSQSFVDCNVTAIELMSFGGRAMDNGNLITWATASEKDSDYFTVERSTDGTNFESITTVKATGNTSTLSTYEFLDNTFANQVNYYRLLETETNGNTQVVSNIVVVERTADNFAVINTTPNPASTFVNIEFASTQNENIEINVYNVVGKLMSVQNYQAIQGINTVKIDLNSMPAGSYLIGLNSANQGNITTRIVKN